MMSDRPRGVIYTGVTSDLVQRIIEHKTHARPGLTSRYHVRNLVWFERHPNIVLAIRREKSLKRYLREWKMELIEGFNPTWSDLSEEIYDLNNPFRPPPGSPKWDDYE